MSQWLAEKSSAFLQSRTSRRGFLVRSARGRMATRATYQHFGLKAPERAAATLQLFEDPR